MYACMHVHDWVSYYLLACVELNILSYAGNKIKFKAKILEVLIVVYHKFLRPREISR